MSSRYRKRGWGQRWLSFWSIFCSRSTGAWIPRTHTNTRWSWQLACNSSLGRSWQGNFLPYSYTGPGTWPDLACWGSHRMKERQTDIPRKAENEQTGLFETPKLSVFIYYSWIGKVGYFIQTKKESGFMVHSKRREQGLLISVGAVFWSWISRGWSYDERTY